MEAEPQPVCWALLNPRTGKVAEVCYVREEAARTGAEKPTNRWSTYVAVPLFLHPAAYEDKS
jgi:hypothetical protein